MKVVQSQPGITSAQLRLKAQEELDAAGGEKIAAKNASALAKTQQDAFGKLQAAHEKLLAEAQQHRAKAADKLKATVGPRGVFSLENIARGFATLMNKLAGKTLVTVRSLEKDPTAKATAARLEKLAAKKEAKAVEIYELAKKSYAEAAKALAEANTHIEAAKAHRENARALVDEANTMDAAAPPTPAQPQAPPANEPAEQKPAFEPGKVGFGGGPRPEVKLPAGPDVNAPLPGEKKASESLVALRWASEAAGLEWQGKGTGALKDALAHAKGGTSQLAIKNGASPFEVKKRIAERLGLPTGNDAINKLSIDDVRVHFAKRDAVGLSRLLPRAEFEAALKNAGLDANAPIDQLAMFGTASGAQKTRDAAAALKKAPNDVEAQKAFAKEAGALDKSKRVMVDVIKATPADDRRILALDACDAVEVAHGKPGATTKLGAAVESVTSNAAFAKLLQQALGLDDNTFKGVVDSALRASEWVSLGELMTPSSVLAFPGQLTDEQRKQHIAPLSKNGTNAAKELGLLDDSGLAALDGHMRFDPKTSTPAAQLLGWVRQMAALSEHRDWRPDLDKDAIVLEMMKNAGIAPSIGKDGKAFTKPASVNPALVMTMGPVVADVIAALR